jgi:transposase-like protein
VTLRICWLSVDGRMVYLWRAVDAEGEVLDVLVQAKWNKRAALKLMRNTIPDHDPDIREREFQAAVPF